MSVKIDLGFRRPTYVFSTDDEANRFNDEIFAKTGVRGSVSSSGAKVTYIYDDNNKLRRC